MAMEIFVFSDRQVGSVAEWQEAIDNEGFALRLTTNGPADDLSGHVPARLGNGDAGFECKLTDSAELMARYSDVDFGHAWKFARAFRSGPDLRSNVASWIGAAIFAKVADGKVFDPPEGRLYSPEELLNTLREVERDILQVEDELESLKPRTAANPSPAIISVRVWKGEEQDDEGA